MTLTPREKHVHDWRFARRDVIKCVAPRCPLERKGKMIPTVPLEDMPKYEGEVPE
jgi:hypothetical protein